MTKYIITKEQRDNLLYLIENRSLLATRNLLNQLEELKDEKVIPLNPLDSSMKKEIKVSEKSKEVLKQARSDKFTEEEMNTLKRKNEKDTCNT